MRCKCGYNFCYLCLSIWSTTIRNGITVEKCARGDQGGSPCPLYTENSLRGIIQRQGPQMRRHDMKWISEGTSTASTLMGVGPSLTDWFDFAFKIGLVCPIRSRTHSLDICWPRESVGESNSQLQTLHVISSSVLRISVQLLRLQKQEMEWSHQPS